MSNDQDPASDTEVAAKLATVERQIGNLSTILLELDEQGLAIAAIHLNDAIESLRIEQAKIRLLR